MSQKVQIASALLSDPEICVLDEPTTGLDPINVRLVQTLLIERRRNGRTTILSTHQMNQVETLCDRIALIDQGKLMEYGNVDDVRRRHSRHEVRVMAQGPLPGLSNAFTAIPDGENGWRLMLTNGVAPADVLTSLVQAGAVIDRFEPMLAPMEDIFLRVVREGHA
jgi:ABC-2 type transport system ATP-binding protein